MVYKYLWVVSFPRCTAGPNIVGSCCVRLQTTANMHATTPNIFGTTMLGVVAPVCTQPYRLHPFVHSVACFCVLLGVVAHSLKPVKRFLHANGRTTAPNSVGSCWPTMLRPFAHSLKLTSGPETLERCINQIMPLLLGLLKNNNLALRKQAMTKFYFSF